MMSESLEYSVLLSASYMSTSLKSSLSWSLLAGRVISLSVPSPCLCFIAEVQLHGDFAPGLEQCRREDLGEACHRQAAKRRVVEG